jgi:hypothetical protein
MKKCKSCRSEIDSKATKCPHCQTDQRGWVRKHPILTIILVLFIIGIASTAGSNENSNSNNATKQSAPVDQQVTQDSSVPKENKSALAQADSYANTMSMSKQGVYDQLVSEYGGKFSKEAAQYAIDNVKADWNANALKKAISYQDTMHLSPEAIRDQLTSDYGEKFTSTEADYAIQHLND